MSLKEMSLRELEELLKHIIEVDNKDEIEALRAKQRQRVKNVRAEVTRKKRLERKHMAENVGKYFIGKFDQKSDAFQNMITEDFCRWVDKFVSIYNQHVKDSQTEKDENIETEKNDDRSE